jgi:serine phosphatase RsbU (regulator of sigma subunit)
MQVLYKKTDLKKWGGIISDPGISLSKTKELNFKTLKSNLIFPLAENLYNDIRRSGIKVFDPFIIRKEFKALPEQDQKIWIRFISRIPEKFRLLNLTIRLTTGYFRTCIITDDEISRLALTDLHNYSHEKGKILSTSNSDQPNAVDFYMELNYLIPCQLKKAGYELVRPAEDYAIDNMLIKKLARAIHSRYRQEIRKNNPESNNEYAGDFDDLPEEIRYSNLDNASHISTKLLAIGYRIRPVEKGFKPVTLHLDFNEIETMAQIEHLRWSWDKRLNGWVLGSIRDNTKKTHPGLVPYDLLPDAEKEKDRELVKLIPALLQDIGYVAVPLLPDKNKKLSYAIKPQGSVHKLLEEIRTLNDAVRKVSSSFPEIDEKVTLINRKIRETITEVQGNYDYAYHIQQTFLPDDLFVRECFPDSFVLFRPKDIVSGDFYFFSKRNNLLIFAAADCTGHGIPGALLSTLGYGITDQAVNEKEITRPEEVLHHLYSKVHRYLRKEEIGLGLSDDMDITLCTFDVTTGKLKYAGVGNPIYLVRKGELKELEAMNSIDGCSDEKQCIFISEEIQLRTGDTIYLFSDGYADQFGGMSHKKYQSSRFRNLLISIQDYSMPEQRDILYEEVENWREQNDEDQTDDILVIGIRI